MLSIRSRRLGAYCSSPRLRLVICHHDRKRQVPEHSRSYTQSLATEGKPSIARKQNVSSFNTTSWRKSQLQRRRSVCAQRCQLIRHYGAFSFNLPQRIWSINGKGLIILSWIIGEIEWSIIIGSYSCIPYMHNNQIGLSISVCFRCECTKIIYCLYINCLHYSASHSSFRVFRNHKTKKNSVLCSSILLFRMVRPYSYIATTLKYSV